MELILERDRLGGELKKRCILPGLITIYELKGGIATGQRCCGNEAYSLAILAEQEGLAINA